MGEALLEGGPFGCTRTCTWRKRNVIAPPPPPSRMSSFLAEPHSPPLSHCLAVCLNCLLPFFSLPLSVAVQLPVHGRPPTPCFMHPPPPPSPPFLALPPSSLSTLRHLCLRAALLLPVLSVAAALTHLLPHCSPPTSPTNPHPHSQPPPPTPQPPHPPTHPYSLTHPHPNPPTHVSPLPWIAPLPCCSVTLPVPWQCAVIRTPTHPAAPPPTHTHSHVLPPAMPPRPPLMWPFRINTHLLLCDTASALQAKATEELCDCELPHRRLQAPSPLLLHADTQAASTSGSHMM